MQSVDGNQAAAYVSYALSDVSFIFPITPSSPMAENADVWASQGRKNVFGQTVDVFEMESEAGASGAVHGGCATGSLVSTYTCSQGLMLMVPNMIKIAGEHLPCVFHVTARALAGQALSIFGDHSDVMACRTTGFNMLSSHNVQQCHDLAIVAHLASMECSLPFMHFFDGFRTSHEIQKIQQLPYEKIKSLIRARGLNPTHPHQMGTSQGVDVFFQAVERSNVDYDKVPEIVQKYMDKVGELTGRKYKIFEYYGAADAERIVVVMGAGVPVLEECVDYLLAKNEKVGVLAVHLYRPWSAKHFLAAIPETVKRIAVLDRTKESGSFGEPLYLDVATTLLDAQKQLVVVGGRYGLGSKEFTPAMAKAVFDNLLLDKPMNHFSVGIVDDVSNLSLPLGENIDPIPAGTTQCMFWGLGSDGTVGANHDAIRIIGQNTDKYVQGYFSYDAHKSWRSYKKQLPGSLKRVISKKNIKFYTIDAIKIGQEVKLGRRINMIMQTVFFKLANVIPFEKAIVLLKEAVQKLMVLKAVDGLVEVKVPESWANAELETIEKIDAPEFITDVLLPQLAMQGNNLPVSKFVADGSMPMGTTKYEKEELPLTFQPFYLTEEEVNKAPSDFVTIPQKGKFAAYKARIQVSALDCTGCEVCTTSCPVKALSMQPFGEHAEVETKNWEYALSIPQKNDIVDKSNIKGTMVQQPYLEFSGACEGCNETALVKLVTQLFGDRLVIANATGCSSIWGGTWGTNPYTVDANGRGPAWANSLFEDNAEYGFGMFRANEQKRKYLEQIVKEAIEEGKLSAELKQAFESWLEKNDNAEESDKIYNTVKPLIEAEKDKSETLRLIYSNADMFVKISQWIIGGDGWAYDIDIMELITS
ncbi:pyruvate dehydrogenase (NADP(+)) [Entamoeba marina]